MPIDEQEGYCEAVQRPLSSGKSTTITAIPWDISRDSITGELHVLCTRCHRAKYSSTISETIAKGSASDVSVAVSVSRRVSDQPRRAVQAQAGWHRREAEMSSPLQRLLVWAAIFMSILVVISVITGCAVPLR